MKCCGSPTTSTAVEPARDRAAVQSALQAVVFAEVLKPLAASLGPYGDIVTGTVARRLYGTPPA